MVPRPPPSSGRPAGPDPEAARRIALGEFLRSRRERLQPARVGLAKAGRRRTPGLRREEVAARAGVGVVWYTWLEQGREIRPSREALAFIADALELSAAERDHLFTLGGHGAFEPAGIATADDVPASLRPVLAALDPCPAYVNNIRWDILAWNAAADTVYGLSVLPPEDRNGLVLMFTRPSSRDRIANWDEVAPRMVASFRMNAGPYLGEPSFDALLARLRQSEDFVRLWSRQDVNVRRSGRKVLNHPDLGTLVLTHQAFQVIEAPALRLVVYTPASDAADVTPG